MRQASPVSDADVHFFNGRAIWFDRIASHARDRARRLCGGNASWLPGR